MKVLGVIPARGGSKGVPRKNIRKIGSLPLIGYSIKVAKESKLITEFCVSTEDEEIAKISEELGASVKRRPSQLALDETPMFPVIEQLLEVYESEGFVFDAIALLQPTCPFRKAEHVDESINILIQEEAPAVIGVIPVGDGHPGRMYSQKEGRLEAYSEDLEALRRQDLPPLYLRNGAIYTIRKEVLLKEKHFFPKGSVPYLMGEKESVNIDAPMDLEFARFLHDQECGR